MLDMLFYGVYLARAVEYWRLHWGKLLIILVCFFFLYNLGLAIVEGVKPMDGFPILVVLQRPTIDYARIESQRL